MSADLPRFSDKTPPARLLTTNLRGQYGKYIAPPALIHAAQTALGLELPLLLTGEPGSGKSDFAWVAARALGQSAPLRCHIRSDTRARDLLYHYDALVRFGDAQHGDRDRARDPRNYISLRPLGAALMSPGPRRVVLLDEIDKAPRDLPNDLLHEIDEGRFEISEIGNFDSTSEPVFDHAHTDIALHRTMERPENKPKPLVIITSNAERQLPEPFLRRCVFFHIPPPTPARLAEIAKARFPDNDLKILNDFVSVFFALRSHHELVKRPTIAEMINWIDALTKLYNPEDVDCLLTPFADAVKEGFGRLPPSSDLSWADLPGIPCLLKLHEDLAAVTARAS